MGKWVGRRDIREGNVMSVMGGLDERLGGMGIEGPEPW